MLLMVVSVLQVVVKRQQIAAITGGQLYVLQSIHMFILLYSQLKKDYVQVKTLHDSSGFGWDDERQLVTATDEVWMAFLEVL